jgi:hypothetical protein
LTLRYPGLIARAFRLERRERVRALRTLGWLIAASAGVRVFSYDTLTHLIARVPLGPTRAVVTPGECAIDVRRASRLWPARCLPQAIAAACLLKRAGLAPEVRLGVARDGDRFDAHAWVQCDGIVVVGDNADRPYAPLTTRERRTS